MQPLSHNVKIRLNPDEEYPASYKYWYALIVYVHLCIVLLYLCECNVYVCLGVARRAGKQTRWLLALQLQCRDQ
eukprot:12820623-Heterocapsa_arctica.AAC.1